MDRLTEAIEALKADSRDLARVAFRRALLMASDEVARLTDGDSPAHDGAIVDACRAIESIQMPECLK